MACQILHHITPPVQQLRFLGKTLSMFQTTDLRALIRGIIDDPAPLPLVVDTCHLELVGSSFFSAIIDLAVTCKKAGIPVVLFEDRQRTIEIFEIASLLSILPVAPTFEKACMLLAKT